MSRTVSGSQEYRFGPFRLLPDRQLLLRDDLPVGLGGRAFELLRLLVEHNGVVVPKQKLFDAVWPNLAVEESNLTVTVSSVRKILGCGVDGARFIATVPGRGYRFVVPVEQSDATVPRAAALPSAVPPPPRTNLARMLTGLVGREAAVERLLGLLAQGGLITVTGIGGVGKTRVAAAAGEAAQLFYQDGVWWVELAALAVPELVAETIAAALGIAGQGSGAALDVVATYLQRKNLLLILDNCEHLIDEAARVAETLLKSCPAVTILATSREPLKLPGEHAFALPPLGLPDSAEGISAIDAMGHSAIRLFVERAGLSVPDFILTDETAPAVAETCRRLDGIALAIELAAPRLKIVHPTELLARLSDRFRILTGGSRTALPRQQTLKAVLDWSYNLLSPEERLLLRRLAVFGGSFTVESAVAVAGDAPIDGADVFELVASLVDKSLIVPVAAGSGGIRYRLLESTRAYGLERLAEADGENDRRRRLTLYLIRRFDEADARFWTTSSDAWLAAYEPDLDNLRAGLDWAYGPAGDGALGARLLSCAVHLWEERSLMAERQRWLQVAASRLDDSLPAATRGRIHLALGYTGSYGQRRIFDRAVSSVALFREAGDPLQLASALCLVGACLVTPADGAQAEPYFREAESLLRPLGATKPLAMLLAAMGVGRAADGDIETARALAHESLAVARSVGYRTGMVGPVVHLAEYDFAAGRVQEAIAGIRAAEAVCRESGNLRILSSVSNNLAGYLLAAGEVAAASSAAREAIRLGQALGDDFTVAMALEHLALAAACSGEIALAARLAGYGQNYYRVAEQSRDTTEAKTWDALQFRLSGALDAAEIARLMAEGALWREDEAVAAATN